MRYSDSPDLFGRGCGSSCCGEIVCEFCGTVHNKDVSDENIDGGIEGEYISDTNFAGLNVCECCFEKIENEILHRMPDILKWYKSIIDARERKLKSDKSLLDDVQRVD